MKRQASALSIGLLAITLTACLNGPTNSTPSQTPLQTESHSQPNSTPPADQLATETPISSPSLPTDPERTEATLLAIGDIMVHMPQLPAYYDRKSDSYNLTPWFTQVKPIFQQGDWVIGNLETPVAGKDLKYTGYPRFNAPYELAEALADAGVQLVSTANNHSMDRGFPGVTRTLDNVKQAGLIPIGTSSSAEEQLQMIIEERNGIRMGFLAYTYGTNGIPLPAGKAYAVNLIDPVEIKMDIARLRQAEADVVTVSLHFGIEYQRMPNEDQTKLARELVEAGADIILGSHPHVVQPYEQIDVSSSESDDGKPRQGIVIYSLGNFISNQTGNWKDVGLIFGVRLVKSRQADGSYITQCDAITTEPTWVHIGWKNQKRHYTVIPMKTALSNKKIPDLTAKDYGKMRILLKGISEHLYSLDPS
ncbi:CapA family protein [Cohnella luojiensis]|uniref:CapA family protein n=1 Tax=Cohnella luojiensis TaxID=652876 RepID=A0A4Y8M9W3_9BACL|nr:CapA family protein [Cohnella luojiensis]TFE30074.1 CapA family protein [Cohnella luojiensis]